MAAVTDTLGSRLELERRIVVHIDMDCFYAQVERKRLDLAEDVPLCVVQWNSILAVSYAARAAGIKRGATPQEAKSKCPECVLVHVETVDAAGRKPQVSELDLSEEASIVRAANTVCLDRYRLESEKIFGILSRFSDAVERCSIDEAFIELTDVVDDFDEAVRLVQRMRDAILDELRYTCSAGVACNKMLAKFASSTNKPNKLTAIPWSETNSILARIPLSRVRGLGGKFGAELQRNFKAETLADLSQLSMAALQAAYEPCTAEWLFWLARGYDPSRVEPRDRPRSLLAAKSFAPVDTWQDARRILFLLATRLEQRIERDTSMHHRRPRTLCVSFTSAQAGLQGQRHHHASRSGPFPTCAKEDAAASIAEGAEKLLRSIRSGFRFPCKRFMLEATNFQPIASGAYSIRSYMGKPGKRALKADVPSGGIAECEREQNPISGYAPAARNECSFAGATPIPEREHQGIANAKLVLRAGSSVSGNEALVSHWKRHCRGATRRIHDGCITCYFSQPKRSETR
jgi:DNA polymerase eta